MRRNRRAARLEITPLMDVMFLVLVFFIYCIFDMAVHRGVKVDLPGGSGSPEKGERIVITVRGDDTILFNGVASSKDDVVRRVRELRGVGMDLPVLVSGDRRASLGAGVELLEALKAAGCAKASFQVAGRTARSGAAQ